MEKMKVNIKRLSNNAIIPTQGSEYAAGYDLYACPPNDSLRGKKIIIPPHTTAKVGTGLSMEIPNGFFGAIFARSGLSTKKGLRPANCVGVCDSDYRGEYIVALHNDSNNQVEIEFGERIAQLVVLPYFPVDFNEVQELDDTDRGAGGFGSSGEK